MSSARMGFSERYLDWGLLLVAKRVTKFYVFFYILRKRYLVVKLENSQVDGTTSAPLKRAAG